MTDRDLADLLATNEDNTTHGKFHAGTLDAAGRPWHAVRAIAVDHVEVREALVLQDSPRVDLSRDGYHVRWSFEDMAFPVIPGVQAAAQIAPFFLNKTMPDFPVRGCAVWIGQRRFWVQYAPAWDGRPHEDAIEVTPRT